MQTLHITDNKRHLALSGGAPLFLIADTAWELFHRLSRTTPYISTCPPVSVSDWIRQSCRLCQPS